MPLIPNKLSPGDAVGIVAPSSPVTPALLGQFQHGVEFLESLGLRVVVGQHVFSTGLGYAALPQEKAADINAMFAAAEIRAVICAQGGATANACLPHIHWPTLRANPKIFLGISDITVLLNAIQAQTGLITFHGNDVMWGFGRAPSDYDRQEFCARFLHGRTGEILPAGPRRGLRGGSATGRLLGGNLHCLLKLAGTPYFPDFSGAVLFLEDIGVSPEACDCALRQLKQMGVFEQLRGCLVGHIDAYPEGPQPGLQLEDILLQVSAEFNFPIIKVEDFGHNWPNTTLPVGALVRLDADQLMITLIEKCIQ